MRFFNGLSMTSPELWYRVFMRVGAIITKKWMLTTFSEISRAILSFSSLHIEKWYFLKLVVDGRSQKMRERLMGKLRCFSRNKFLKNSFMKLLG